jgi:hypothetical protein
MAFQSFEDLEVWQRGCRLAVDVFKTFAKCRNFTLQDQVQRKLDFISKSDFDRLTPESKEISAMLHGLSRAVEKRVKKRGSKSEP